MNETIGTWFEENQKAVINLTYDLWSHPELAYHEYHACQAVAKFMREQGFFVETKAAEAFHDNEAEPNTVIAISQRADVSSHFRLIKKAASLPHKQLLTAL